VKGTGSRRRAAPAPWLCGAALLGGCAAPAPSSAPARPAAAVAAALQPSLSPEEAAVLLARQVEERERGSAPAAHHRRLAPLAGEWAVVLEGFGPDGAALGVQAEGRATIEWILGGRYLRWDSELELAGRLSRTTGFLGYDKGLEEYLFLVLSDLATGMPLLRGRGDLEREGISLSLAVAEELRLAATNRGVLRLVEPDTFTLEQLRTGPDGRERLDQRATYRRVRAASP
jgi:hypothetical protein